MNKTKILTIAIKQDQFTKLSKEAESQDRSLSSLFRKMIDNFLELIKEQK